MFSSRGTVRYEERGQGYRDVEKVGKHCSKGYNHCELLSCSRHRLLNLPDTRRVMQRQQSIGPAFIGQAV